MIPYDVSDWEAGEKSSGTKSGVWIVHPRKRKRGLVKQAKFREQYNFHEGETWAERLASLIGQRLTLPVPEVDAVQYKDNLCPLSWDIRPYGWELREGVALATSSGFQEPLTLANVVEILETYLCEHDARQGVGRLVLFDILTGNCDRHWHNWGVLLPPLGSSGAEATMAHFYDNGSALGSNYMPDKLEEYCRNPKKQEKFDRGFRYEIRVQEGAKPGLEALLEELTLWDRRLFGFIDELEKLDEGVIDSIIESAGPCYEIEARRDFSRLLLKRRRRIILEWSRENESQSD